MGLILPGGSTATAASEVFSTTVTLTAAQLAAAEGVGVVLVPAPGEGKFICPVNVWVYMDVALNTGEFDFWLGESGVGAVEYVIMTEYTPNRPHVLWPANGATAGWDANAPLSLVPMNVKVPGAITASSINTGGTLWAVNDTFKVGDAEFVVTSVDAPETGVVTGYTMTAPGTTNILATGVAATDASGSGVNLTFDITSLDYSVNPMTLKIKTLYTIMDV